MNSLWVMLHLTYRWILVLMRAALEMDPSLLCNKREDHG